MTWIFCFISFCFEILVPIPVIYGFTMCWLLCYKKVRVINWNTETCFTSTVVFDCSSPYSWVYNIKIYISNFISYSWMKRSLPSHILEGFLMTTLYIVHFAFSIHKYETNISTLISIHELNNIISFRLCLLKIEKYVCQVFIHKSNSKINNICTYFYSSESTIVLFYLLK